MSLTVTLLAETTIVFFISRVSMEKRKTQTLEVVWFTFNKEIEICRFIGNKMSQQVYRATFFSSFVYLQNSMPAFVATLHTNVIANTFPVGSQA